MSDELPHPPDRPLAESQGDRASETLLRVYQYIQQSREVLEDTRRRIEETEKALALSDEALKRAARVDRAYWEEPGRSSRSR